MAKDPAFLFYPGDWLSGTMYLTHEQKGAYMDLLILQFNVGKFSEAQAKQVLSICFAVAWPMLQQKFILADGLYYNERLQSEIEKRKSFSESRRNNAKGGKSKKNDENKAEASAEHMHKHMEDENENINSKEYILKKECEEKISVLTNVLCDEWGFTQSKHHKQKSLIFNFVHNLGFKNQIDDFIQDYTDYKEFKKLSGESVHRYDKLIGSVDQQFEDGIWKSQNWSHLIEEFKTRNKTLSKTAEIMKAFDNITYTGED